MTVDGPRLKRGDGALEISGGKIQREMDARKFGREDAEHLDQCEADAKNEANTSDKFYRTAEDNMKSVVEALTLPLVKGKGYSIAWVESK